MNIHALTDIIGGIFCQSNKLYWSREFIISIFICWNTL